MPAGLGVLISLFSSNIKIVHHFVYWCEVYAVFMPPEQEFVVQIRLSRYDFEKNAGEIEEFFVVKFYFIKL